jgi:hypothetical protein
LNNSEDNVMPNETEIAFATAVHSLEGALTVDQPKGKKHSSQDAMFLSKTDLSNAMKGVEGGPPVKIARMTSEGVLASSVSNYEDPHGIVQDGYILDRFFGMPLGKQIVKRIADGGGSEPPAKRPRAAPKSGPLAIEAGDSMALSGDGVPAAKSKGGKSPGRPKAALQGTPEEIAPQLASAKVPLTKLRLVI